jgi:hypothetical protein
MMRHTSRSHHNRPYLRRVVALCLVVLGGGTVGAGLAMESGGILLVLGMLAVGLNLLLAGIYTFGGQGAAAAPTP